MQNEPSAQSGDASLFGDASLTSIDAAFILARELIERAAGFLPNVIGAIIVFIVGMWLAGRLRRAVRKWFERSARLDETLESFLCSFVYYAMTVLVIVTTLGVFGVQTTSLAAVIGAAGLAVGLALQGTLGHLASGVMLLAFRPFKVGDYVEAASQEGNVKAITLFTTELATLDNKKVIIPNGEVWASSIVNYSAYDTRRITLIFGISYNDDINRAIAAIEDEISNNACTLKDPEPAVGVDSLGDSAVNLTCRVWVNKSDFLKTKWALTKAVKERFDKDGINIPFPTTTIIRNQEG